VDYLIEHDAIARDSQSGPTG